MNETEMLFLTSWYSKSYTVCKTLKFDGDAKIKCSVPESDGLVFLWVAKIQWSREILIVLKKKM